MKEIKKMTNLDYRIVDISQPHLCAYWTERLGVAETIVKEAIAAVGSDPEHIECYINKMVLYYTHVCAM